MSMPIFRILPCVALAAVGLQAQQATVAGPIAGYVFDASAQGVRPILGLPGASLLGDPLSLGFAASSAFIAPRQDMAFVIAGDGSFHLFRINSGTVTEFSVDGLGGAPDRVVFSPSGTAAALYGGGSIQVITGLPGAPTVAGAIDVSSSGVPDSFALSDDGTVLLLSAGNAVRLIGSLADMGKLMDTAGSALLAFAAGTHDAAITDPTGAGVVLFHDLTGAGSSQVLAPPDATISASSAEAFSMDGKSLLLASASAQSITTFDLGAGARNVIACSCKPNSLSSMGSVFRLNDLGKDPLWLLDTRPSQPQVLFVPALSDHRLRHLPEGTTAHRLP